MNTTTNTTTIQIGQIWSTFKTNDKLVEVIGHAKGWYEARVIYDGGNQVETSVLKLRAKDFDLQYIVKDGAYCSGSDVETETATATATETETETDTKTDVETETETPKVYSSNPMTRHIARYADRYLKVKTPNCQSRICGDELSELLRNYHLDAILTVASAIAGRDLGIRYLMLNNGQKRMNAGNVIRNAIVTHGMSVAQVKALLDQVAA